MADTNDSGVSPFHVGEQQVQQRLGVRDKIEGFARRIVSRYLPDEHRQFYELLPFLLVGTVDGKGRPWASMLVGKPGFITTPDETTLAIDARPVFGDPLNDTLKPGTDVGVLGFLPAARRRNRLTAKIRSAGADGIVLDVDQTFGNCPQYIQTRDVEVLPGLDTITEERPVHRGDHCDDPTRALIENADTLFIATAYREDADDWTHGADVSHRGGRPGFVRMEDQRTLVFADYSGNNHYNTVGNIVMNPKAGFLFPDFDSGDLVHLTGEAEIVWDGPEVKAFKGAERLIRLRITDVIRIERALPLRFDFGEWSPTLDFTGTWKEADAVLAAEAERNTYLPYEVFRIQRESDLIKSFYLRRADGKALAGYEPGQFLPIRVTIPGRDEPAMRTYTLSDAPGGEHYRLSIKREGGDALVSTFLHDNVEAGFQLEAMAPRGKFVLDQSSERPVVLLSAGVGVTPMMAITNFIVAEGHRTRFFRRTYFIHGAKNGGVHAFRDHIRQLAAGHDSLTTHYCYSRPTDHDLADGHCDSQGRVDVELLKRVLPFDDYDFYLCGPGPFMSSLYEGLTAVGVRAERIHYESFGPATVLKPDAEALAAAAEAAPKEPVQIAFAQSGIETTWTPEKGTLLELAEEMGLSPPFSCRTGICGTCATRIQCGAVDYVEDPSAPREDNEVLICCSTPRSVTGDGSCGETLGVVLDL